MPSKNDMKILKNINAIKYVKKNNFHFIKHGLSVVKLSKIYYLEFLT